MCGIALVLERIAASVGHESVSESDALQEEIRLRLAQRGPDHVERVDRVVDAGSETWRVQFHGAVLHLRGDSIVTQPVEDAQGNVLCWNAEIFGGPLLEGIAETENDTQWLAKTLTRCCDDDPEHVTTRVLDVFQHVEGPFAFLWFHAASQRIFFGHDRFGRRSLLYHSSTHTLLTTLAESIDNADATETSIDVSSLTELCLSSVALKNYSTGASSSFQEVPSTGIYVLDLQAQRLAFHSYTPIVSATRPPASAPIAIPSDRYQCAYPQPGPTASSIKTAAFGLLHALSNAVGVRVRTIPRPSRPNDASPHAYVGVLFSGGLDSVMLAALTHFHVVAPDEPIDLLNVCFDATSGFQSPDRLAAEVSFHELCTLFPTRKWNLIRVNIPFERVLEHQREIAALMTPCETHMDFNIGAAFWFLSRGQGHVRADTSSAAPNGVDLNAFLRANRASAAQEAADKALKALGLFATNESSEFCPAANCRRKLKPGCPLGICRVCCTRARKLLAKLHVDTTDTVDARERVKARAALEGMLPSTSQDVSTRIEDLVRVYEQHFSVEDEVCRVHRIKTKAPTASEAKPDSQEAPVPQQEHSEQAYTTRARVLLVGIGADEQLGGYGRHKTAYLQRGLDGLQAELARDMRRIWKRNLGRDDRCISAHGREARFPFLDEQVVRFLASLPLDNVCDFAQERGEGDKRVLRLAARLVGLTHCATLAKRAIQFGTRIAKHSNAAAFGSNRQATGDARFVVSDEIEEG
ncbi:hypothetical protein Poli38472_010737 [Pythium oligandrum]|uniref:Asparagine synthetase domain-containing protein n=1 Tax=Pythium oligandrum TaxID=41045 RepID=A0A8K1CDZ2_PYTOL|nr:hypothetical protein Poli38472_010737 [Pythium oligandrum]|eukprot:TMW61674.1 hypothetical protein Poli38472_010737 [Pythium oligandrum]